MAKNNSKAVKAVTAISYIFISFFVGATFILVVEELGEWYSDSLKQQPLWHWWLYSMVTGVILIVVWRFIIKTASEIENEKK
jgi:uncharacterized membrane protein